MFKQLEGESGTPRRTPRSSGIPPLLIRAGAAAPEELQVRRLPGVTLPRLRRAEPHGPRKPQWPLSRVAVTRPSTKPGRGQPRPEPAGLLQLTCPASSAALATSFPCASGVSVRRPTRGPLPGGRATIASGLLQKSMSGRASRAVATGRPR